MKTTEKNGSVMGARQVLPKDDLMLVSTKGQMIRIHVGDISEQGRNTQGVRLMNISGSNEKVVSFEYLAEAAASAEEAVGESPSGGETVH
jgi:DNA gyrase subunit A